MSLTVEKGTKGGICNAIHRYVKANNKYMKNYDKNIESSYLRYLDANNLQRWGVYQKMPVNGFKWIKKLSKFDGDFMKNNDDNSCKGYTLEVHVEYPKNLLNLYKDLPFLAEKKKNSKI